MSFKLGDLVWAKMRGFPPWPGMITEPSEEAVNKPKKPSHWIYFFGTKNYSWIDIPSLKKYDNESLELNKKQPKGLKEACEAIQDVYNKGENSVHHPNNGEESRFDRLIDEPSTPAEDTTPKAKSAPKKSKTPKASTKRAASVESSEPEESAKKAKTSAKRKPTIEQDSDESSDIEVKRTPKPKKKDKSRTHDADTTTGWSTTGFSDFKSPITKRITTSTALIERRPPPITKTEGVTLDLETVSENLLDKKITPSELRFGFLGLGNMGSAIVKNLLHSKHQVTIWNRSSEKVDPFLNIGAKFGQTPSDVVAESDITFSCVSDTKVAKDLLFGNCGALSEIKTDKCYVEMTSIDSETSKIFSEAIIQKGGKYLEAQIHGGKEQAIKGSLLILTAGDRALYDQCYSCFEAIGRVSYYFGPVGMGCKMNHCLQLMSGVYLAGLAEALTFGDKMGLTLKDVKEVIEISRLTNDFISDKLRKIDSSEFSPDQSLQLMQKDMSLVLRSSDTYTTSVPLAAAANETFKHACRLGYGDHDCSSVFIGTRF